MESEQTGGFAPDPATPETQNRGELMNESVPTDARPSGAGFAPGTVGVTAPSNPDHHGAFLSEVIAELGFADRDTVENAVEATRETVETPESYLVESGAIDERQLSLALAERSGLDHVDLDRFELDPGAVATIGKAAAARYTALPIAFATDGALLVAIADPYNMPGISAIEAMTRREARPVIAAATQIRRLIPELPEEAPPPVPEPPPPPPQATPVADEPDSPPHQRDLPLAAPPDSVPELDGSEVSVGEEVEGKLGDLSAVFATLQEKMHQAGDIVDTVERRWRQGAERERELEERLNDAQERIAALEESQSKTDTAGELANAASEKLAELRGVLEDGS